MSLVDRNRLAPCFVLLLGLAPATAWAGAAGGNTVACEATQQIHFVHDDDADGVRDPGETTACANPTVDASGTDPVVTDGAGGTVCLPAVVAQLRGTMTLIADDDAKDSDVQTLGQNTGEVFTMLLEVRHENQVVRLADSYTASSLGNLILGNWDNRLNDETKIFGVLFSGALLLTPSEIQGQPVNQGSFDDFAARLSQKAEEIGLVPNANDVVPLVATSQDAARKRFVESDPTKCGSGAIPVSCGEFETQEDGSLASIAVYRVTVSFAEKVTGLPPSCS